MTDRIPFGACVIELEEPLTELMSYKLGDGRTRFLCKNTGHGAALAFAHGHDAVPVGSEPPQVTDDAFIHPQLQLVFTNPESVQALKANLDEVLRRMEKHND